MDDTGKKLLNLMFRLGEGVCLSPNQFSYHSIPLENALSDQVTLVPTQESAQKRNMKWEDTFEYRPSSEMLLVALNPIQGWRSDSTVTAYRNFLVEVDTGSIPSQLEYLKKIGLPYSAIVFSGNKSLHGLVSLDQDLPSQSVYRKFSQWILNIATIADPLTKNPSRCIRIPGAYREPGKKQVLVEFKGPTKLIDLVNWLQLHPEAKPKEHEKRKPSGKLNIDGLKPWVADRLINGLDPNKGRNSQFFAIACEFALAGLSEYDTIEILYGYFVPDKDFKEKEWLTTISSAFKYIYDRK